MMFRSRPSWAPADIPLDRPGVARMYDFYLGGNHNFEVDRQAAAKAIAFHPDLPLMMRANRAFLRRSVEFVARQGIDQFLDLGSGIPTVGRVHQIVRRIQPEAWVVYVDIDPITVMHSLPLLAGDPRAVAIEEDIRNTDAVLNRPEVRAQLDVSRPIAVLMLLVLHNILDDTEAERTREIVPISSLAFSRDDLHNRLAHLVDRIFALLASDDEQALGAARQIGHELADLLYMSTEGLERSHSVLSNVLIQAVPGDWRALRCAVVRVITAIMGGYHDRSRFAVLHEQASMIDALVATLERTQGELRDRGRIRA